MSNINKFNYDEKANLFSGYYDENIDIIKIHTFIRRILTLKTTKSVATFTGESINYVNNQLNSRDLTLDDSLNIFCDYIDGIKNISSNILIDYDIKAEVWIDEITNSKGKVKIALIEQYINIIKEFMNVNIIHSNNLYKGESCSECGVNLSEEDFCLNCGMYKVKFMSNSSFIDTIEVDTQVKKKNPYDKFKAKYLRYQGRSEITIPQDDIDKIKTYIDHNYIIDVSDYRRINNIVLLREVLSKLSLNKYSDDINVLIHVLWDYSLPNLKHLDKKIENNWNKGQSIMLKHKTDKDSQNISYNAWRLWRELLDVGHDCDREEFTITSNKETLKRLEQLWKIRCDQLKTETEH